MPTNLSCQQCGNPFTCTNREASGGRKFCSTLCYRAHEKIYGRERPDVVPVKFSCKNCGAPFQRNPGELRQYRSVHGKDPLYCSRNCSHIGRTDTRTKSCAVCSAPFDTAGHSRNRTMTCSDPCRRELQRRNLVATNEITNPSAERQITKRLMRGYVLLRFPNINGVKGEDIYEHRYVMEQHLGRKLTKEETVHHRLKPTTNNDLSNLELFSSRHGPGQRVSEQIDWAIKIMLDYPEFLDKAGYALIAKRFMSNLNAPYLSGPVDDADHPPSVS